MIMKNRTFIINYLQFLSSVSLQISTKHFCYSNKNRQTFALKGDRNEK